MPVKRHHHHHQVRLRRDLKLISYFLRHGASRSGGITFQPGGWVSVPQLLSHRLCKHMSRERFDQVVARSTFEYDAANMRIRALDYHSIEIDDPDQTLRRPITEIEQLPPIVYFDIPQSVWYNMIMHQGIHHMNATHIHCYSEVTTRPAIIKSYMITLHIDARAALRDGFQWFVSPNGYWQCKGNEFGVLPRQYIVNTSLPEPHVCRQFDALSLESCASYTSGDATQTGCQ